MEDSKLLQAALAYALLGWRVLPVHGLHDGRCTCRSDCGRRAGKHPLETAWPVKATCDPAAIRNWVKRWPDANLGVACGAESSLWVLDVEAQGLSDLEKLETKFGPLPKTPTVETGSGGRHLYFSWSNECQNLRNRTKIGGLSFDVRTAGGFVVGPPSVHRCGGRYRWLIDPTEVDPAEAPDWLLRWLANGDGHALTLRAPASADDQARIKAYVSTLPPSIQGQNGSADLMRAIRQTSARFKLDRDATKAAIVERFNPRCAPPWSDREIEHALENIFASPSTLPAFDDLDGKGRSGGVAETADDGGKPPKKSVATRLVELALGCGVELFHDPAGEAFARFAIGDHHEVHGLASSSFKRWLARRYYECWNAAPNANSLADAITILSGTATFEGPEYPVHVRVAEHDGRLFVDLGDPAWRVVEIDRDGWRIVTASPVRFRRPGGMLTLPDPQLGGPIELLRPFVNAGDREFRLVTYWLLSAMRPGRPCPVLCLRGEPGSGKSQLARMLRSLVDPHEADLRRPPREETDLSVAARNSHVVALENLSGLASWLSDALCVLCTGGSLTRRKLYSDGDENVLSAMRPVLVTAIENIASRSDLADRTLSVELCPIADADRKDEATLNADFEAVRKKLLGALLDAVARGLRDLDTIRPAGLPRMADAARWSAACCQQFGWMPDSVIADFLDERAAGHDAALADCIWWPALDAMLEKEPIITGTASELLSRLAESVGDRVTRSPDWPKRPASLVGQFKRLAAALRSRGITVESSRRGGGSRTRTLKVEMDVNCRPLSSRRPQIVPDSSGSSRNGDDLGGEHRPPIVPASSPDGVGDDRGTTSGRQGDDVSSLIVPHSETNPNGPGLSGDDGTMRDDKIHTPHDVADDLDDDPDAGWTETIL